jgi:hypothetical protein
VRFRAFIPASVIIVDNACVLLPTFVSDVCVSSRLYALLSILVMSDFLNFAVTNWLSAES